MPDTPDNAAKSNEPKDAIAPTNVDPCPHCGAAPNSSSENLDFKKSYDRMGLSPKSLPSEVVPSEGLTKWEQDTFRDIINNVNNTLRFQIQLAVPILAGCVTSLNIVPPQEHQEFLNLYDRWVFIPVVLSMGVAYHGLEIHWGIDKKTGRWTMLSHCPSL